MTPTLIGRLQTRLLLVLVIGLPVIFVLGAVLGLGLGRSAIIGLVLGTLSLAWEFAWHGLQQLRWDRDWPSAFALLAGVPEAVVGKLVLGWLAVVPFAAHWSGYTVLFATSFVTSWLAQQGPLRVLFPAARFDGGRLLGRRTTSAATSATPITELLEPTAASATASGAAGGRRPPRPTSAPRPAPRRPQPPAIRASHGSRGRRRGMVVVGIVTALAFLVFTVLDLAPHHSGMPMSRQPSLAPIKTAKPDAIAPAHPWTAPATQSVLDSWDTHASVAPYALTMPSLNVQAAVESVAMVGGSIASPTKVGDVGWYSGSASPGHAGPSVLIGLSGAGPFARIGQLVRRDTLLVTRSDATTVQYVVTRVQTARAAAFPAKAVYRATPRPTLRLVSFDRGKRSGGRYTLVFATAVHLLHPKQTP